MLCDDDRRAALGSLHFPSTEVLNLSVFFSCFSTTRILLHSLPSACRLMLSDAQNETGVLFRVDHLKNTFGAYPGQAFAYSCEKRCGFCGRRVSLQRKETSLHRGTLESFHKLLGRKNATTEVHAQLMSMLSTCQLVSMLSTIFLSLTLPESVTKPAAASEHQTQRVLSSFP